MESELRGNSTLGAVVDIAGEHDECHFSLNRKINESIEGVEGSVAESFKTRCKLPIPVNGVSRWRSAAWMKRNFKLAPRTRAVAPRTKHDPPAPGPGIDVPARMDSTSVMYLSRLPLFDTELGRHSDYALQNKGFPRIGDTPCPPSGRRRSGANGALRQIER